MILENRLLIGAAVWSGTAVVAAVVRPTIPRTIQAPKYGLPGTRYSVYGSSSNCIPGTYANETLHVSALLPLRTLILPLHFPTRTSEPSKLVLL